jgi:excinuclease ABC subunit B
MLKSSKSAGESAKSSGSNKASRIPKSSETQKSPFTIKTTHKPAGDQPKAIESLVTGLKKDFDKQTLLGVTGSGKTFTIANVIEQHAKPTLVIAHNKTLAAQLAQEFREFFPDNAVHYFVSYYDYYQPEAYIATSDTYIEKEAQINEEIERLRHASTQALLTRKDVIIVASVSCIYGLGSPEEYEKVNMRLQVGQKFDRFELTRRLIHMYYERTSADLTPGTFRALGNSIEIMPVSERVIYRINFNAINIEAITLIDEVTRRIIEEYTGDQSFFIFPAKHFVTPEDERERAIQEIKVELEDRLEVLQKEGKILEAERLKRRTSYDLAMIKEVGYCNGIENYSRIFAGKKAGEAPDTLLSYFPHKADGTPDFLTVIDESHVTIPQLRGMFAGDASRKKNLIDHGFRLPSAADNRPLKFPEFLERVGQMIFTTATPATYELEESENIAEQIIRPTGLIDPILSVRPVTEQKRGSKGVLGVTAKTDYPGQIFDFIAEVEQTVKKGYRALATTLTKKMAEDLTEFLKQKNIKAKYLHSDVETIERIQILTELRKGEFDVLVGVNLLREGLDLPEVALIGILDADKEGFLRSETSLIQTIGRAARNVDGKVILYADKLTGSLERAIQETERRRAKQIAYNTTHGITPKTIAKKIQDITEAIQSEHQKTVARLMALDEQAFLENPKKVIKEKESQMEDAVRELDFETAAILRDEIKALKDRLAKTEKQMEKLKKEKVKGVRAKKQWMK